MHYYIGADEVGRGCLAGDLYVAAVMVPQNMRPIEGVDDSKKLSPSARERAHKALLATDGVHYRIARRTAQDIDERGIVACLEECFSEVIHGLLEMGLPVGRVWVDGEPIQLGVELPVRPRFVPKGDALDWVIGAASVIAKVERDAYMVKLAEGFPGYGWARNKGYGSPEHTRNITLRGPTEHHRLTFCKRFLPKDPEEVDVFDLFTDK